MTVLLLSGVGGSSNWLPFIYPLIAIILLVKGAEILAKFVKNKLHHHEEGETIINDITGTN